MMLSHLSSCFLIQYHCSPGVFSLLFLSAFQWFKLCDFLSVYFVNEKCIYQKLHTEMQQWISESILLCFVGKGFHYLPVREVSWDSEAEDFTKDMCAFFFFSPGNLFYKGVLLGLATLLIPKKRSFSKSRYHILTVIVQYFGKILWRFSSFATIN